eukprot:2850080-Prymnesium_polylepis.1
MGRKIDRREPGDGLNPPPRCEPFRAVPALGPEGHSQRTPRFLRAFWVLSWSFSSIHSEQRAARRREDDGGDGRRRGPAARGDRPPQSRRGQTALDPCGHCARRRRAVQQQQHQAAHSGPLEGLGRVGDDR